MRHIGASDPQGWPAYSDEQANIVLTAGSAAAVSRPTDATHLRVGGATTASGGFSFAINLATSAAVWPAATVDTTTNSSGLNTIVPAGESRMFQLPAGTTAFGLISGTSGIVSCEFWKRGG